MSKLNIVDDLKDFFKTIPYNLKYGSKFKKFNIDKELSDLLICRSEDKSEREIFQIISKSKTQDEFQNNVKIYLKSKDICSYASILLLGNLTGKYVFSDFYFESLKGLNIDAFSKDNLELLEDLKKHFPEYIMNNNKLKNTFAEIPEDDKSTVRDLSLDIKEENLVSDFEKVLEGEKISNYLSRSEVIADYIVKVIGRYSKDDIKNNFDFILYDINNPDISGINERREKYLEHSNLSNNQLRKVDDVSILKERLQSIGSLEANNLISRLNNIENDLYGNIKELEDIYTDYEVLYREDLIDKLYIPNEDVTIIENYEDIRPQLIHQFIRNPEKFRSLEYENIKEKIISERNNGNTSEELTDTEQKRFNDLINRLDAELDQYQVNYSMDGKGTAYTDSSGLDSYHSDTSNQISASILDGTDIMKLSSLGIIGIGFNKETLLADAIAISSNSYKTTNKGINNLEYNEDNEFKEMSSPFNELINSGGRSEIVMYRRGMDFDTKASYIIAAINSSNEKQTNHIMEKIEKVREKENLKVVIYDLYKIRQSYEQSKTKKVNTEELIQELEESNNFEIENKSSVDDVEIGTSVKL